MLQSTAVGRLARDPVERNVGNTTVVDFSIAISQLPKKDGTEVDPIWLSVAAWGQKGDYCMNKLKKGSWCIVSGPVKEDSWIDKKSGEPKKKLVIKAETVGGLDYLQKMPGGSQEDTSENRAPGGGYERTAVQNDFADGDIPF